MIRRRNGRRRIPRAGVESLGPFAPCEITWAPPGGPGLITNETVLDCGEESRLKTNICADPGMAISLSAVKKTWRSIYERVGAHSAGLMPIGQVREEPTSERGKDEEVAATCLPSRTS